MRHKVRNHRSWWSIAPPTPTSPFTWAICGTTFWATACPTSWKRPGTTWSKSKSSTIAAFTFASPWWLGNAWAREKRHNPQEKKATNSWGDTTWPLTKRSRLKWQTAWRKDSTPRKRKPQAPSCKKPAPCCNAGKTGTHKSWNFGKP